MYEFQSSGEPKYSSKHLKTKLCDHYGKNMLISCQRGKETLYTFLDAGNSILRSNFEEVGLSRETIIDMASMFIREDIRSKTYDMSKYPSFSDVMAQKDLTPASLQRLLDGIVKDKSDTSKVSERREVAIADSMISAVRTRLFVSPLLLSISGYINALHESRELIDILSSLGFADDYREVQRLYDAMLPHEKEVFDPIFFVEMCSSICSNQNSGEPLISPNVQMSEASFVRKLVCPKVD